VHEGQEVFVREAPSILSSDHRKETGRKVQDIPVVRDFPDVFPEDVSGLPPILQVKFCIDLPLSPNRDAGVI
jgi:hypothetical protein